MSTVAIAAVGSRGDVAPLAGVGVALQKAGHRVLTIGEAPHHWTFPQMAAVAHHCGAGTTAASLRFGVPTIALPGPVGDQPFWARRLDDLGASAATIPQRALTADKLADAIRTAAADRQLSANTKQLAVRIAGEDGAARVVATVENLLQQSTH